MKDLSVHIHLMYEEIGCLMLEQLGSVWRGKVYMSLIKGNYDTNNMFMRLAEDLFSSTEVTLVEDKGNDQWGFYNTYNKNKDDTKYILYFHDKKDPDWTSDLIEPFITKEALKESLDIIRDKGVGIVSAKARKQSTLTDKALWEMYRGVSTKFRSKLVLSCQTVRWLKELQYILAYGDGLGIDNLYPDFCAGTIFLAKRDVVATAHKCVHSNFFTPHYATDGEVEHGLERFYFYVSECLGYENEYV